MDFANKNRKTMWDKFVEAVDRHFRFLETDFAFARTSEKPPFVIFESDKLRIMVFYDVGRGHELDLVIRRISDGPRKHLSISIEMLIELRDGHTAGYLSLYPSTDEALETEIKHLAKLLREYGAAILEGDLRDFGRVERIELCLAKKFGKAKPESP